MDSRHRVHNVFGLAFVVDCVTDHPKIVGGGGGGGGRKGGVMVTSELFLLKWTVPYVMNLAWCGCTIFDLTT